ncbi:hypothetical protein B4U45_13695 [Mycobacterium persicum]|uniref:Uncharacterized protein n=1 Tax=Mycobacterium persicum TaxID=1487726 RepID=A0A8E2IS08_9MYCO|nr:hypothetical protein [Mycobacterium persicum]ORB56812.1 hypothetical protein BST40_04180 [Mycobacterium persicum]ORB95528.1 hypothetical protein B1T44_14670 [Mycobacterium persicum]ORC02295.1 hypothetical protein B1T48_14545 [Mycobacterium persicum]ORC07493.1 hypothetical protein B4U45_13695 [Mycobacterium persicum]
MSTVCRDCRTGVYHCHGTVIRHDLGRTECTENDCDGPEISVHGFVIDCDAVGCRCADAPNGEAGSPHRVSA